MEKSTKRGKIPQSDWPLIMARYEAGETLASIARTYDCSPPAISYVVSRSRARQPAPPAATKPPVPPEPQLIKAPAAEAQAPRPPAAGPSIAASPEASPTPPANGHAAPPPASSLPRQPPPHPQAEHQQPQATPQHQHHNGHAGEHAMRTGNGYAGERNGSGAAPSWPRPPAAAQANGENRGKLHLSLGNPSPANGNGNQGGAHAAEPGPVERQGFIRPQPPQSPERGVDGAIAGAAPPPAAYREHPLRGDEPGQRKQGAGSFIDLELRARVEADISAFLAAFDGALDQDSPESRSALREATDRLLRAGARTRIELERLEARVPLPPRDGSGRGVPAWPGR